MFILLKIVVFPSPFHLPKVENVDDVIMEDIIGVEPKEYLTIQHIEEVTTEGENTDDLVTQIIMLDPKTPTIP